MFILPGPGCSMRAHPPTLRHALHGHRHSHTRYDGLGHRICWHYDVDTDGTVEADGAEDPYYYFVYDER